ncbi:IS30 family transposase, partial [Psychrobacter sp. Sa4CVA2]|nr:IS30 family transposase [Psychrobacter communis]
QRGTNENTNGLIREYLPKGCDFRQVTDNEIQDIENKLNNRPRKRLGAFPKLCVTAYNPLTGE